MRYTGINDSGAPLQLPAGITDALAPSQPSRFRDDAAYQQAMMLGLNAQTISDEARPWLESFATTYGDEGSQIDGNSQPSEHGMVHGMAARGDTLGHSQIPMENAVPRGSGMVTHLPRGEIGLEVSDQGRDISDTAKHGQTMTLGDVLTNSEDLFAAYPALRGVPVEFIDPRELSEDERKAWSGLHGGVNQDPETGAVTGMFLNLAGGKLRETLLHEVQHLIDVMGEGERMGGHHEDAGDEVRSLWSNYVDRLGTKNPNTTSVLGDALNAIAKMAGTELPGDTTPQQDTQLMYPDEEDDSLAMQRMLSLVSRRAMEDRDEYLFNEGETLARLTGTRRDLSPEGLAAFPPKVDLDIPMDLLGYKFARPSADLNALLGENTPETDAKVRDWLAEAQDTLTGYYQTQHRAPTFRHNLIGPRGGR